ncbi:hypothetical protein DAETH_48000 (plasmid) [Deinococcus aetherius]|uniref:O-antigen ligase-related domain-containing protein n=1 Tax=Deinococcus aetherius TaxID=200252 RepID=A0ABN6RS97_9DEIO|nr:O-antigen ligase family protein [Deinococcus aetherius]BDP44831.1 hypothetical protein DAETH_48000 [Deinococcus aetherius]
MPFQPRLGSLGLLDVTYGLALLLLLGLGVGLFAEDSAHVGLESQRFALLVAASGAVTLGYTAHVLTRLTLPRPAMFVTLLLVLPLVVFALLGSGTTLSIVALLGVLISALVIHERDGDRALRTVAILLALALALSLLVAVLVPGQGRMPQFDGAWRGLLAHKNRLGGLASFGVMLALMYRRDLGRWLWLLLPAAGACLLGSRSSTALVCTGAALTLWAVLMVVRSPAARVLLVALSVTGTALGLGSVQESLGTAFAVLGKDASFTGRVPLWEAILTYGNLGPLGYGLNTYWVPGQELSSALTALLGWQPYYSHNGYIEAAIVYGWAVASLLIATLLTLVLRALLRPGDARLAALGAFFLMYNFSEAVFTQYDNPLLPLGVLVFLVMHRALTEVAPERRPTGSGLPRILWR